MSEETRSEHVMIRLKPSEKELLEKKALERGVKPTQLAYQAVIDAITAKYSVAEITELLDKHSYEMDQMDHEVKLMRWSLEERGVL